MSEAAEQITRQFANAMINKRTFENILISASVHGADPTKTAVANTAAIQSAIDAAHISTTVKTVYIPQGCTYTKTAITYYNDVIVEDFSNPAYPTTIIGSGDAEYRLVFPNRDDAATNAPYYTIINERTTGDRTCGIMFRYGSRDMPFNTWQLAFGRPDGGVWHEDFVMYSHQSVTGSPGTQISRLILGKNGVYIFNPNTANFDPGTEAAEGYTYVFNQRSDAASSDPLGALFYTNGSGALNIDIRAGTDAYRNRFSRTFLDTKLRLKAPDLTTDLMTWANDGTVGVPGGTMEFVNGGKVVTGLHFSGPPTTGTWKRGDIAWNVAPDPSGFAGWICTTGGTPGTWKTFAAISA